jgi:hypothetical protein
MQAARARAGRVVTDPLAGLLCDLGPGRAWLPRGLPTSAAVSGTAVTEIFVPGYDAAAALQVKLPPAGPGLRQSRDWGARGYRVCWLLVSRLSLNVEVVGMTKSRFAQAAVLVATLLVLVACAAGPNNVAHVDAPHIAGFWLGLWHGAISPITFLISLFNHHVSIYDVHNNGNWYNFGFMIGASAVFSGAGRSGAAARPRRKSRPQRPGTST